MAIGRSSPLVRSHLRSFSNRGGIEVPLDGSWPLVLFERRKIPSPHWPPVLWIFLTPPALADIRPRGCQFRLLRLVPRVRDPTPVLQAAAVGVPSPLRQLVLHIRPTSSTDRHPTPKPRPPCGNVLSADSFLEFKILKSQLPAVAVAGTEIANFQI